MLIVLTSNVNSINIGSGMPVATPLNLRPVGDFATLRSPLVGGLCGDSDGPLAAIGDEPRQARKGATVVTDSGAGVWLSESPPYSRMVMHVLSGPGPQMAPRHFR
jgi:hypothetical protein